jgi:hypothetical protein
VNAWIAAAAATLALAGPATRLSVAPWTGNDFQTTSSQAAKYRLEVDGKPGAPISLRASGVADGWLAAFCTAKYCSPQRLDAALPPSGVAVYQFELIRESAGAPEESGATIAGTDGATVKVPAVYRE